MVSPEGDQLLTGAFHPIMDKIKDDILEIEKKKTFKVKFHSERFQL